MIRTQSDRQLSLAEFDWPFQSGLDEPNRWVKMSQCIPWDELAEAYYEGLSSTQGRPSKDARLVIGAVIIKHKLCLSDRETVAQIQENPYLQYFVGLPGYPMKAPFAPSLFVEVRKRMGPSVFDVFYQAVVAAVATAKRTSASQGKGQATSSDDDDPPPRVSSDTTKSEPVEPVPQDGVYPEVVLGDRLYGNRANRRYLKACGSRFAGKPLGRPKKVTEANWQEMKRVAAQRREEYLQRIPIEGKFGQGKNGYRLNYIRAKRSDTSAAWINSIFLVMNLLILLTVFSWLGKMVRAGRRYGLSKLSEICGGWWRTLMRAHPRSPVTGNRGFATF